MYLRIPYILRVIALSLALVAASTWAFAQPPVDRQLCEPFAEMSVGIRAMAIEKVGKIPTFAILEYWYPALRHPELALIARAIIIAAESDTRQPVDFARAFYAACVRGETDGFLGRGV